MRVLSIKKVKRGRVINLTVHKNHTFVTKNGIVTHNCDNLTKDAQQAFRGFLDEYGPACAFIFTGNYSERIIEPLMNRLENYDFGSFKKEDMIKPIFERLCFVLDNEGIQYNKQDLGPIIKTYYPSIRQMIGSLQKLSADGVLKIDVSSIDSLDVYKKIIDLCKPDTYYDMISAVNALTNVNGIYSYLYHNANIFFREDKLMNVVVILAKYQDMSSNVRDLNLNLSACLTELMSCR